MKKNDSGAGVKGAALFLTPASPYPAVGGGALRTASLLEYLAQHYTVDTIIFREPGAEDPARALPGGLVREAYVINLSYHAKHALARVARNAGRLLRRVPPLVDRFAGYGEQVASFLQGRDYELSIVNQFWCAPYWEQLAPRSRRTIIDLQNVESVLHAQHAEIETGPVAFAHHIFYTAARELEGRWLPRFSSVLIPSEEGAGEVQAISPGSRVIVYPNAIPRVPQPRRREQDEIVFSGNLEYHPNISGVRFFRREIWPLLRKEWPTLVWRLIGKNPHAVRKYTDGDARIEVSGPVQNAIEELAAAKVAVVPLLSGSGTRLKIIEAWAAGRPVVSTRLGAEGLPARHGENILLADDAENFAGAVSALLNSPSLRAKIGQRGRKTFEQQLTWEAAWRRLDSSGI